MNITELARILKITPQELHDSLPQLGFDIGQKAIKINYDTANKIIKEWPILKKKLEKQTPLTAEAQDNIIQTKKTINIPEHITVREFSQVSGLALNSILSILMKNGIFASLNEKIDFETAWLVGETLGIEVKKEEGKAEEHYAAKSNLKDIMAKEKREDLLPRPPVIVVMGHVDHGKTKLLDAIRRTNVAAGEAGGITQHIGAYQITRKGQIITFIDTPGHEAFTAMRSRGAKIADIAILVVAADDGVKPQTIEAFQIIKAAKIPFVVAINKVDKLEANIDKTKQELSTKLNIVPEDWGGQTICLPVSALKGTGINELLDMVLLTTATAATEAAEIKANPNAPAVGTVIESHIDKGSGPVATILVQNGTLRVSDQLTLDNIVIGRVRGLGNYLGEKIAEAGPATPVQIIGLKTMPQVGDVVQVGIGEKIKFKKTKNIAKTGIAAKQATEENDKKEIKKVNLIIKSDVLGSAEAIEESLEKINKSEVKVKIVHKGLGNISDGDIKRAEATNGAIVGFNVKVPPQIAEMAREKNIEIKIYNIIYDLINDINEKMQALVSPTFARIELGKLRVLAVFKTEKNGQIIGGKIIDGRAEADSLIEVRHNDEIMGTGKLAKLQAGKQDVTVAQTGQECGVQFAGEPVIKENDILHFYKEEEIKLS